MDKQHRTASPEDIKKSIDMCISQYGTALQKLAQGPDDTDIDDTEETNEPEN